MIETPGFFWTVLFFLLAIGPLVFIHEMGHYLVARWCGVKSEVFSIGFGREVAGWTDKRGTRWKIGWMPLGGYVRFAGDANAASQEDGAWRDLSETDRAVTFPAQALWKKSLIVVAGPAVNFIAGFLIFALLLAAYGDLRMPAQVGSIAKGSVAEKAGFRVGDRIEAIGDRRINGYAELVQYVYTRPEIPLTFVVARQDLQLRIAATPAYVELRDEFGNLQRRGLLGIGPGERERVTVDLIDVPSVAATKVANIISATFDGIGQILFGNFSAKELSGPLKMAQASGQVATMGWITFIGFVAFVSINLGFINLLPIPMLDGGHLFFYAVEAVIRRPVPPQAQEWAFRGGFMALMALMIFVTINDLGSFGVWQRLSGLIG